MQILPEDDEDGGFDSVRDAGKRQIPARALPPELCPEGRKLGMSTLIVPDNERGLSRCQNTHCAIVDYREGRRITEA